MKGRDRPSTQAEMCRLIPIARSSVRPKPSSLVLWGMKGKFYKKYREESEYPIYFGQDKMEISVFLSLSSWEIPWTTISRSAEANSL